MSAALTRAAMKMDRPGGLHEQAMISRACRSIFWAAAHARSTRFAPAISCRLLIWKDQPSSGLFGRRRSLDRHRHPWKSRDSVDDFPRAPASGWRWDGFDDESGW